MMGSPVQVWASASESRQPWRLFVFLASDRSGRFTGQGLASARSLSEAQAERVADGAEYVHLRLRRLQIVVQHHWHLGEAHAVKPVKLEQHLDHAGEALLGDEAVPVRRQRPLERLGTVGAETA